MMRVRNRDWIKAFIKGKTWSINDPKLPSYTPNPIKFSKFDRAMMDTAVKWASLSHAKRK
jgi:hypothetical protein